LSAHVPQLLETIQGDLYRRAETLRNDRTYDVASIGEALEVTKDGFARLAWADVVGDGEKVLNAQAVSVRCLQRADGSMPTSDLEEGLVALVAKSY